VSAAALPAGCTVSPVHGVLVCTDRPAWLASLVVGDAIAYVNHDDMGGGGNLAGVGCAPHSHAARADVRLPSWARTRN
jgi:hypothetical protein